MTLVIFWLHTYGRRRAFRYVERTHSTPPPHRHPHAPTSTSTLTLPAALSTFFPPGCVLYLAGKQPGGRAPLVKNKIVFMKKKRRLETRSAVLVPGDAAPALPEGVPYCGRPRVVHTDGEEHHDVLRLHGGHQVRGRGGAALHFQGVCVCFLSCTRIVGGDFGVLGVFGCVRACQRRRMLRVCLGSVPV